MDIRALALTCCVLRAASAVYRNLCTFLSDYTYRVWHERRARTHTLIQQQYKIPLRVRFCSPSSSRWRYTGTSLKSLTHTYHRCDKRAAYVGAAFAGKHRAATVWSVELFSPLQGDYSIPSLALDYCCCDAFASWRGVAWPLFRMNAIFLSITNRRAPSLSQGPG